MRDFEKAKAWNNEREADAKMAEEMLKVKRNQQLKMIQMENFDGLIKRHSQTQRQRDLAENIKDGNLLSTVPIQDIVDPIDDNEEKIKKANITKELLKEQTAVRQQAREDGNGKFFGMTDEEILLNKDLFTQMGLI